MVEHLFSAGNSGRPSCGERRYKGFETDEGWIPQRDWESRWRPWAAAWTWHAWRALRPDAGDEPAALPGDGPGHERVDSFAFQPFPGFGKQVAIILELGQRLLTARLLTKELGAGPVAFEFQLGDSLLEHLFRPADLDGRIA